MKVKQGQYLAFAWKKKPVLSFESLVENNQNRNYCGGVKFPKAGATVNLDWDDKSYRNYAIWFEMELSGMVCVHQNHHILKTIILI